ncbi:unnamed protein product [Urochloa decumbens]|uniref:BTB domain-containing protein n=1 Tax=Urochloa decumbens TaxID=240449 RepID=A0ABC8YH96_9POAL
MPPAERAAGDLGGTFSASGIVGGTVTGHHLLHIDCYSQTKEELPTYYPNGVESSVAEFISIYLCLEQSVTQYVKARVRFSLLDQAGEPVPSHSHTTKIHGFCATAPNFGYRYFIKRALLEESEHLKDDSFTIRCDVTVTMKLRAEKRRPASPLVVVPPSNLHRNFGDLLASEDGADVTFQVASKRFKAHRYVLAARSPVFKAEVLGTMKESTSREAIRVDDIDEQVFRALLNFAAMAQHLLVAADRYNLERLKLICEDRLCSHIDTASAATILALAEQHCCPGLKEACFGFLSSPSALNAVMTTDGFDHLARSCPSVLKEVMANIASRVPVGVDEA